MDFVYICRSGDNEELRYSIRSVVHSFPDAKVWVVGGKPDWYSGGHIPITQNHHKYANAFNNIDAICNSADISETFVLMNDDFFIVKKIDSIEPMHGGLLSEKINRYTKLTGSSMYIKKLILTHTRLKECSIDSALDYELHVPMVMEKDKLKTVIKNYPSCLWRSMYGNLFSVGGNKIEDVKVYNNKKHLGRSKNITEDSIFISTEDLSFNMVFETILRDNFKNKTTYEL
jgi:hypothetical protein